jgi:hydrogenase expression/formation protein HypC
MCLGIPARVVDVRVGSDLMEVDMVGAPRLVNGGLLDAPARAGDWVLVHMGYALATMTDEEAHEAMATLASMARERTGQAAEGAPW